MGSAELGEYAAFKEKVRRTVYMDNLSPHVTESVMRTALDQYGTVKSVQFIPNYLGPQNIPQCALVEMEKEKQAQVVISTISQFPFMMSGMPRPARARAAEAEMFADRPRQPGRQIHFRWLDPADPDFEVANKLKRLAKKHATETAVMLKVNSQSCITAILFRCVKYFSFLVNMLIRCSVASTGQRGEACKAARRCFESKLQEI